MGFRLECKAGVEIFGLAGKGPVYSFSLGHKDVTATTLLGESQVSTTQGGKLVTTITFQDPRGGAILLPVPDEAHGFAPMAVPKGGTLAK
jgi:hypothetical protein